jgi:predicted metal-dependent phosphoesterase TrpH
MFVRTDLHAHTYHSDGRATPDQLVAVRAAAGLRVIAVSDHDVFRAVPLVAELAAGHDMTVLPAAELTSVLHFGTERAEQIHILAYFPPERAATIGETFLGRRGQRVAERWRAFVLDWLDGLDATDRAILESRTGWRRLSAERFPGLQQVIDRLAASRPELYHPFRRHHVRFWLDDRELFGWTPEELIEAIRGDGAVDVIAHPVRYKDTERLESLLERVRGIEVYTSRHAERVAARFRALAEAKGKLWTASTDDHQKGPYAPPPSGTPVSTLEVLLGRPVPEAWFETA